MTESIQGKQYEDVAHKEAQADGSVEPGRLLDYSGTGPLTVEEYDTNEPTGATFRIAMEPLVPTDASTDPINETYNDGDHVQYRVGRSGDTFDNARLAAGGDLATASEANISAGDKLAITNENGETGVLKQATTSGAEVAIALEAVDNSSAAAGSVERIHVEVL